jgi:hypothetical protein
LTFIITLIFLPRMLYAPPVHLSAPSTGSWFFTGLCIAIFAGALVWSLARAARGDWLALACLLGGLVANLIEAMLDHLGLLWFASNNHLILFHEFGGAMPLYVVLGYGFYFGAISYFTLYSLRRSVGSRFLWGIYLFAVVFDWALETTGGEIGIYRYYGPQPFRVLTEPLWWVFINPALPIAAGGLFHVMRDRLRGWRALSIVALLPMVYGATYGATAWPIFIAFHSTVAHWVIWVAAAVTDALALAYVALIINGLDWSGRLLSGGVTAPVEAPPAVPRAPASEAPVAVG